MSPLKRILWGPFRFLISILLTILSLVLSGTGCMARVVSRRTYRIRQGHVERRSLCRAKNWGQEKTKTSLTRLLSPVRLVFICVCVCLCLSLSLSLYPCLCVWYFCVVALNLDQSFTHTLTVLLHLFSNNIYTNFNRNCIQSPSPPWSTILRCPRVIHSTHCNALQHTTIHRNRPQHSISPSLLCSTFTHCDTLQHTVTHRNTPQHTATCH